MRTEISSVKELPGMHMMGHTCTNLNGDLFFVWGGTNEQVAYLAAKNTDLWIYETLTGYWRRRTCTGDCPPHLSSSASCLVGRKMFVFGGHSTEQDNWLNCLYCLDLETFVWRDLNGSQVSAKPTKPIRSDKNVCWSYEGKLYLFGGYGWSQTEHYLEILDRQPDLQLAPDQRWPKFGWNNQLVSFDPSSNVWEWPRYTGKCPSARAAHSGALMGDKYFIFGGRDSCQRLNDLYILDMKTLNWQQINLATNSNLHEPVGPIRHLLEGADDDDGGLIGMVDGADQEEDGEAAADGQEQINNLDNQELVDEMRDDDDEDDNQALDLEYLGLNENPSPSSSTNCHSSDATRARGANQTTSAAQDEDDEDDYEDDEDDGEEYPYRSHLLERWSLSSSSHQQSGADQECRFNLGEQETNPSSQSTIFFSNSIPLASNNNNDSNNNNTQQEAQVSNEEPPVFNDRLNGASNSNQESNESNFIDSSSSNNNTIERFPMGRSFCSFTPISDDRILLYGGVSSQDQKLDDCWLFDTTQHKWTQIDLKHKKPRLWHTGSRTRQNEVVIIGGSNSDKIDEFSNEVIVLSMEPKTLKRLALDAVSRSVRLRTIQKTKGIPSTICKLIRLRKQAMALTLRSPRHQ